VANSAFESVQIAPGLWYPTYIGWERALGAPVEDSVAKTREIYSGQPIAGRLLEVTYRTKEPILRKVEEPDGSIRIVYDGCLETPKGARGLGLSSDGRYVRILVDGVPRKVSRVDVRYVEEVGQ
jgi:hypothetical protein